METRRHIEELQTLRGFAALLVALSHLTTIYAIPEGIRIALDLVLNAHAAVIIFFILSGYVLTGSLVRRGLGRGPVAGFYIGRFFRLYPAVWFVSFLSIVFLALVPLRSIFPSPSSWFISYLSPALNFKTILLSFAVLKFVLLPPLWSVFVEFLGSFLMPALVAVSLWRRHLLPWLVAVMGLAVYPLVHAPHMLNYLCYMFDFGLGVLIATYGPRIVFSAPLATITAASTVLLFFRPLWFAMLNGHFVPIIVGYNDATPMIVEALAGTILIAVLAAGHGRSALLNHRFSVRLGDISFSFYLIHFPLGMLLAKLLSTVFSASTSPMLAMSCLVVTCLALSLVFAELLFRFVEIPTNNLGKRVSAAFAKRLV